MHSIHSVNVHLTSKLPLTDSVHANSLLYVCCHCLLLHVSILLHSTWLWTGHVVNTGAVTYMVADGVLQSAADMALQSGMATKPEQ